MRYTAALSVFLLGLLQGCSPSAEPAPAARPAVQTPKRVMDHTPALIQEHLISSRVVPDHVLDHPKLPGGSVGEYENKGRKYRAFIIDTPTGQDAALILFNYKADLKQPEYISYMGGYFGNDGKQNVYVFAKLHYVAGIAGLSKDEADPLPRTLASRIH